MEIQYVIINFLLVVAIVVIAGRKTIKSIFTKRLNRINDEFKEIEQIEKTELPEFKNFEPEAKTEQLSDDIKKAELEAQSKIKRIEAAAKRECYEIHKESVEKAGVEILETIKKNVCELFSQEPYLSALRAHEAEMIDNILKEVKLTPGDLTYLKHHDVLYVTLSSAHKLSEEIVKKVDSFTTEMLNEVNGKTSLWVLEDPSLIGGVKLRIGDTVYDCTVSEDFYRYEKSLRRVHIPFEIGEDEILKEFTHKAETFKPKIHIYQLGRVMTVSDGICWMDGLADIMYGEVIEFDCGERGMVLDIQHNRIGCVVFGEYENIESGSRVRRIGRIATVPVGDELLGRVVDSVGNPIDGEGYINTDERRPIEFKAPAILDRESVSEPLHTGIKAVDALVPIGKGQRELIIGDRQTGKSAVAIDAIINQKGKDTICIYVAIGQKESTISEIRETLEKYDALKYTVIVAASASGSAATQYIAPFSATAMGEYFMYNGKDVLIVYDDLSKHAVAYRELSLLLHRPSGREAYPGDIFYLHSRLLERSAKLSEKMGGGSMTALPIIETQAGDISAYIPTNVISITDGQIFLDGELYNEGQRPAINVGLSVSRVGGSAQTKLMKQVSANLRTKLAQYRELIGFVQFGAEVDAETAKTIETGKRLTEGLKQARYKPLDDKYQALLLLAISEGYSDDVSIESMAMFEEELYKFFDAQHSDIMSILEKGDKLSKETLDEIKKAMIEFKKKVK
ncbi:MAG: F0F1 ATP synthase subunit alpha [Clostridia bacterium]|nr:F0F1 ATP synthase subunit alpha [Clostridia bacterium]